MATSIEAAGDRSVSIGRIFSRAFGTMGSNPVTVFGITFLFGALPSVVMNYVAQQLGYSNANLSTGAITPTLFWTIFAVTMILTIAFVMLTQGALVRATAAHSEGREASFGESAGVGLRFIVPLFLLGLALGAAVFFASLIFFIPGIILYVMWIVAAPALVEENIGVFDAFSRSRHLTKGVRWKVFGLVILIAATYIISAMVMGVIAVSIYGPGGLAALTQQGFPLAFTLVSAVVSTLLNAIVATIQTSLYIDLRDWKDGPAGDALTDIFA